MGTVDILPGAFTGAAERLKRKMDLSGTRPIKGWVKQVVGTVIHAVVQNVQVGEVCRLRDPVTGIEVLSEVVGLADNVAILSPMGGMRGLSTRTEVIPTGRRLEVAVGPGLIGQVLDGLGRPMGNSVFRATDVEAYYPLQREAPESLSRALISDVMPLNIRLIDGFLTCAEGQRIGVFGEAGGGKSTLLSSIVRGAEADVCVIGLIGERGREVREFMEHSLGEEGMKKSVLVVSTSDRPAMERMMAAYTATAVAEYFRDQGKKVLLLMDSVTRFARALREIGLAAGEPPTRRGFTPSVFATLPQLMERAGMADKGSITGFYTVLMEGDGVGDPVAEETRSILDGHIILSAKLARSGQYPAIDILSSRSRVMDLVTSEEHVKAADRVRALYAKYQELELLIQVGEYRPGGDPMADEAVQKIEAIRTFLKQGRNEFTTFNASVEMLMKLAGHEA